jgi:hypothetical protein
VLRVQRRTVVAAAALAAVAVAWTAFCPTKSRDHNIVVGQIAEAKAVDQVFKHRPMTYGMQYVT